ncbi:alpha/beta hydrolase [soil metagenome]
MQAMNAPTTATDGIVLEGRLRRPAGTPAGVALLLPPHPAFGGTMDVWMLPAIAERLAVDGWASLRINFRGVAGSGGAQTGGVEEERDAAGALAWLVQEWPGLPTAVVGWSFGAMIGLRLGPDVDHWVGIGPPTRRVEAVPLAGPLVPSSLPPRRTVIVGEHDQFFGPDTVEVLDPHQVVIVEGADHFMFDRDPEIAALVAGALAAPVPGVGSDR